MKKRNGTPAVLDASLCSLTRESIEEAEAIAGGCMEIDWTSVTAEESVEAEDSFLRARIERAEEWEREKAAKGE